MLFAGMILEGGDSGYDTNVETGGTGARYPVLVLQTNTPKGQYSSTTESSKHTHRRSDTKCAN